MQSADIAGRWVNLRTWSEEDLAWAWENACDMERHLLWNGHAETLEEYRSQLAPLIASSLVRVADDRATGATAGVVQLYNINLTEGWGFLSTYSAPAFRRRPHLGEANMLMLDMVFGGLGFRKVFAETFEFNVDVIKTMLRTGAEIEGRLREHTTKDGRRWDLVYLGLTADEWTRKRQRLGRLFSSPGNRSTLLEV